MMHLLLSWLLSICLLSNTYYGIPQNCWQYSKLRFITCTETHTKYIVIVDFDLPITSKRLWVVDMTTGKIVMNTYVSHGRNSGDILATQFSDKPGSYMSSLGLYITSGNYIGHSGLSEHVRGLDTTNHNAEIRDIEIHGATYIGEGKTGHSLGCFAVPMQDSARLVHLIGPETLLIAYHS